ncbi:hypothetical protein H9I32_11935 [Bacillus sp. Xin]|uniref:hypothetical protein n=1 Tax=unclassified Bacillus (in: firmicutes) TaxID=185979 RepID=UPI001572BCCF|nr:MULTISPECIES: hypothetical protein [unclassified Bacillus (in: firmicutes)]MBC6973061.1 hypothetical protein [Bacillus sp. Xin]NSW37708.1 hypothetical protein [Bacillus sp. Xin1]
MAKNKLAIKVDVDTQEALKQMKEVTEAANECMASLEKLERVMNRFKGKSEPIKSFPKVDIALCGEVKASDIIQRISASEDSIRIF